MLLNCFPHHCLSFSISELWDIALASNSLEVLAHHVIALGLYHSLVEFQATFDKKMIGIKSEQHSLSEPVC